MNPERQRQSLALGVSLLVHALLLSLAFGGQGLGLPGFGLPWQERRAEVPALRVVLVPVQTLPQAAVEPTPTPTPAAAGPTLMTAAVMAPMAEPSATAPVAAALRAEQPPDTQPAPVAKPAVVAVARPDDAAWVVPPAPTVIAAASSAPGTISAEAALRQAQERIAELAQLDRARQEAELQAQQQAQQQAQLQAQLQAQRQAQKQAAQQDSARQEAARVEAARLAEAERQEEARQLAARQIAARQETVRLDAARQEASRAEAARLEAERQDTARLAAARQETARAEAARQESARQEAARQEAAQQAVSRQEAARQEAARQDAARSEAARLAAARLTDAQAAAESREAKLRAIGRQLNEEADRRDAAAAAAAARQSPSALPSSLSTARRGRLFGRTDANAELVLYAEAWSRKIQLNMGFDMVREAARQPHTDPLVTVAIRSDGSVESVSFVRSSGVAAIDEAIKRIVLSQANYPAFQPALAREYDVIEIRRTWHFDMAIRLY